jgi:hypothetical protein
VLLYGATGASALPTGKADAHPEKIVDAEFLWQLPAPREAFFWAEGANDLDGDGLPDLLLPEPDGYCIARQVKGDDGARSFDVRTLRYPGGERDAASPGARRMEARARYRELQISFSLGEGDESLLQVLEGIPNPVFTDYDGDGRRELFALSGNELNVWRQGADGTFPAAPTWGLRFPVTVDQGRRLDLSFGTRVADLTGDGRADCVILAGDRRSEEIRTQILVYTQHGTKGLFADGGRPDQVLMVLGFAGATDLVDVDGDGDLDLVFGTVKLDSIDKLLAVSGGGVEAEFRVHLNEKQPGRRVFSQTADYTLRVKIESGSLREAGRRISAKFIPDVSGDGRPDLLLRPTPEIVRILEFRRIGNTLRSREQPFWQTRVHEDADMRVVEGPDGAPPELLLRERRQVHHVRFTR